MSSPGAQAPFSSRHIGPRPADIEVMLDALGLDSLEALVAQTVPAAIRTTRPLDLPAAATESEALAELRARAVANKSAISLLGQGYHGTITPPVILRNVIESPAWYTPYTPYQAELAQGRLEALLNFQTVVSDLTGLPLANASLLDEGTAAAEAMTLCHRSSRDGRSVFWVADNCHPQTIDVVRTRAVPQGIEVRVAAADEFELDDTCFGALVQYPGTDGIASDLTGLAEQVHAAGGLFVVAADLLSLTLLRPPGEMGADVAVGSTQRFGVPMGMGGPHAAFFATTEDHKRVIPGRIVGVSKDSAGRAALRLALQTREQHIRRDRATSNICTSQVLLAVVAGMYAVYHGPDGLRAIAERVRRCADATALLAAQRGAQVIAGQRFDTVTVRFDSRSDAEAAVQRGRVAGLLLRDHGDGRVAASFDEVSSPTIVAAAVAALTGRPCTIAEAEAELAIEGTKIAPNLARTSLFLEQPVFSAYRAEHELLRYIYRLQSKDLALTTSMIPLGSCTMKLNAAAEMMPVTWPEFGGVHPFSPAEFRAGFDQVVDELAGWLGEITGLPAVSLQPNAGSQGEYAGLLAIRGYHEARGESHRHVCLIPQSAHGTNPASAVMAGLKVVVVRCDDHGNIDVADLRAKATEHASALSALMVTYPSTHGVFEESIVDICGIVHEHGGQVYMDGANMNAQVGLCRPGEMGVDVCHLNLHKTFCIPHGGGGPGMGPICAAEHLRPHLPSHSWGSAVDPSPAPGHVGAVAAAPHGSPLILVISWMYIRMMGPKGLQRATEVAILNANYCAARLQDDYPVLYRGANGRVAHELILDMRPLKKTSGVTVTDIAKRLMDYGFHAPTVSWPVAGTMMLEPTESESKEELDRFCDALLSIRAEIRDIEDGRTPNGDNLLVHAPHTAARVTATEWNRTYTREQAAYPAPWTRVHKFWPPVERIDEAYGDRHLVCSCVSLEDYEFPDG